MLVLQKTIYLLFDMLGTCSKLASHVHCDLLSWVAFFSESSTMSVAMGEGEGPMCFLIGRHEKPRFQVLDSLPSVQAQTSVSWRLTI